MYLQFVPVWFSSHRYKDVFIVPAYLHFTCYLPRHLLSALVVTIVIMVVFLPNFIIASRSTAGGTTSLDHYQWHESMTWMCYNTPDPGLDFDAIYDRPPASETFQYPGSAYGVMSRWNYGHVIIYFGHRIPNATPFLVCIDGSHGCWWVLLVGGITV